MGPALVPMQPGVQVYRAVERTGLLLPAVAARHAVLAACRLPSAARWLAMACAAGQPLGMSIGGSRVGRPTPSRYGLMPCWVPWSRRRKRVPSVLLGGRGRRARIVRRDQACGGHPASGLSPRTHLQCNCINGRTCNTHVFGFILFFAHRTPLPHDIMAPCFVPVFAHPCPSLGLLSFEAPPQGTVFCARLGRWAPAALWWASPTNEG